MFPQVAHDLPAPDCEAFVQLGSSTICDVSEAVSLIKQAENMYVSNSDAQVSDAQGKQSSIPCDTTLLFYLKFPIYCILLLVRF